MLRVSVAVNGVQGLEDVVTTTHLIHQTPKGSFAFPKTILELQIKNLTINKTVTEYFTVAEHSSQDTCILFIYSHKLSHFVVKIQLEVP